MVEAVRYKHGPFSSVAHWQTAMAPTQDQAPDSAPGTLFIGYGIAIKGCIDNVSELIIHGSVETGLVKAGKLTIFPGGVFKGNIDVATADVAGTIIGRVTATEGIFVRSEGHIRGVGRTPRIRIDEGGQINGRLEMQDVAVPIINEAAAE